MPCQEVEVMDEKKSFKELEKEFESTFVRELIPGILHNFANPLNGILGRSKLLQRRAKKNFEVINNNCKVDGKIREDYKKIIYDIDLITKEADKFFDLFTDLAGKFYRLSDTTLQRINLSELIETEIAFLQFYLDFKHNVKKKLVLDKGIPEVLGVKADYSISLSAIIKHSMNSMKDNGLKELIISTSHDDSYVYITIEDTGSPICETQEKKVLNNRDSLNCPDVDTAFFCAVTLLKKYDALFQVGYESGFNVTSIRIPLASAATA